MSRQVPPFESQRCPWERYVSVPAPVQVPVVALSDVPDALEALTTTFRVFPTSVEVGEKVLKIAPAMSTQEPPSRAQRCHWYVNTRFEPVHVPGAAVTVP